MLNSVARVFLLFSLTLYVWLYGILVNRLVKYMFFGVFIRQMYRICLICGPLEQY